MGLNSPYFFSLCLTSANPPYSQAWNPADKENDPRFARFGLAPKGKADYAFLLHDLFHLKSDGIMTIVLPHGVLFRGGEEGEIRKNLIEQNHIDAIIGLPANIFYGTGIPTIIMVLKQKRPNTDVLIVDASKGFEKAGKNNKLRASDIKRIVDVVSARESIDKFSRAVARDEIRKNEYNLNIPRYVDSSEAAESWDIYASMFGGIPLSELNELKDYWAAFPELKTALFENTSSSYCALKVENIQKAVNEHPDIGSFEKKYRDAFGGFDDFLYNELIEKMNTLNISKAEADISADIFDRLKDIPLVDKYEAYQLLDDTWKKISVDLEIIQTEGFEATKRVDPNMVVKKKDGKNQEIQEGWAGRIIPFDLIQDTLLADDRAALKAKENRLTEIASEYEELFDSLTEEEKEGDYAGEDGFINAEIKKALKSDSVEPDTKEKLRKAAALAAEEKELKAAIKKESGLLEGRTKETIESLSDEQVIELLKEKWITPLIQSLMKLPDSVVNELVSKLEALTKKYDNTFADVENQISETESTLSAMIDDLEGNEFDMLGLNEFKKMLGGCEK